MEHSTFNTLQNILQSQNLPIPKDESLNFISKNGRYFVFILKHHLAQDYSKVKKIVFEDETFTETSKPQDSEIFSAFDSKISTLLDSLSITSKGNLAQAIYEYGPIAGLIYVDIEPHMRSNIHKEIYSIQELQTLLHHSYPNTKGSIYELLHSELKKVLRREKLDLSLCDQYCNHLLKEFNTNSKKMNNLSVGVSDQINMNYLIQGLLWQSIQAKCDRIYLKLVLKDSKLNFIYESIQTILLFLREGNLEKLKDYESQFNCKSSNLISKLKNDKKLHDLLPVLDCYAKKFELFEQFSKIVHKSGDHVVLTSQEKFKISMEIAKDGINVLKNYSQFGKDTIEKIMKELVSLNVFIPQVEHGQNDSKQAFENEMMLVFQKNKIPDDDNLHQRIIVQTHEKSIGSLTSFIGELSQRKVEALQKALSENLLIHKICSEKFDGSKNASVEKVDSNQFLFEEDKPQEDLKKEVVLMLTSANILDEDDLYQRLIECMIKKSIHEIEEFSPEYITKKKMTSLKETLKNNPKVNQLLKKCQEMHQQDSKSDDVVIHDDLILDQATIFNEFKQAMQSILLELKIEDDDQLHNKLISNSFECIETDFSLFTDELTKNTRQKLIKAIQESEKIKRIISKSSHLASNEQHFQMTETLVVSLLKELKIEDDEGIFKKIVDCIYQESIDDLSRFGEDITRRGVEKLQKNIQENKQIMALLLSKPKSQSQSQEDTSETHKTEIRKILVKLKIENELHEKIIESVSENGVTKLESFLGEITKKQLQRLIEEIASSRVSISEPKENHIITGEMTKILKKLNITNQNNLFQRLIESVCNQSVHGLNEFNDELTSKKIEALKNELSNNANIMNVLDKKSKNGALDKTPDASIVTDNGASEIVEKTKRNFKEEMKKILVACHVDDEDLLYDRMIECCLTKGIEDLPSFNTEITTKKVSNVQKKLKENESILKILNQLSQASNPFLSFKEEISNYLRSLKIVDENDLYERMASTILRDSWEGLQIFEKEIPKAKFELLEKSKSKIQALKESSSLAIREKSITSLEIEIKKVLSKLNIIDDLNLSARLAIFIFEKEIDEIGSEFEQEIAKIKFENLKKLLQENQAIQQILSKKPINPVVAFRKEITKICGNLIGDEQKIQDFCQLLLNREFETIYFYKTLPPRNIQMIAHAIQQSQIAMRFLQNNVTSETYNQISDKLKDELTISFSEFNFVTSEALTAAVVRVLYLNDCNNLHKDRVNLAFFGNLFYETLRYETTKVLKKFIPSNPELYEDIILSLYQEGIENLQTKNIETKNLREEFFKNSSICEVLAMSPYLSKNKYPISKLTDFHKIETFAITSKSMISKVREIVKTYEDQMKFHEDLLSMLFYIVKREQKLKSLHDALKETLTDENQNATFISEKLLKSLLLNNSDYDVRQKVTNSLETSNPILITSPPKNLNLNNQTIMSKFQNDFNLEPYWIFDNSKITILSYGLDSCKGKSQLLNQLFGTTFEESQNRYLFEGSIDYQSDKNFLFPRHFSLFDAHGTLDDDIRRKILKVVDSVIIHISFDTIKSNRANLLQDVMTELSDPSYSNIQDVWVFVRDCKDQQILTKPFDSEANMKKMGLETSRKISLVMLPNFVSLQNSALIYKKIRDKFFQWQISNINRIVNREKSINKRYLAILNAESSKRIESINDSIQSLLTIVKEMVLNSDSNDRNFLSIYPLFNKISGIHKILNKKILTESDAHDASLNAELFKLNEEKKLIKSSMKSKALIQFQEIVLSSDNVCKVYNFICQLKNLFNHQLMEKRKQALDLKDAIKKLSEMNLVDERAVKEQELRKINDLIESKMISIEVFWREVAQFYLLDPEDAINKKLVEQYKTFAFNGDPFEIIDGDNIFFPHKFLKEVFANQNSKILVVGIFGPQNSGKSTLLNHMFGCVFNVSDGRCTKGVYGSLIKSPIEEYDYFLILDTEGMQSVEKSDPEYDRKITLFVLAICDIVIINVKDQIDAAMTQTLEICAKTLSDLAKQTMEEPVIFFVQNQKANVHNIQFEAMQKIINSFNDLNLKNTLKISHETFFALPSAFKAEDIEINDNVKWRYNQSSSEFIDHVSKLTETVVNHAKKKTLEKLSKSKIQRSNSTLSKWIDLAHSIYNTINQFKDLTRFGDIQEMEQNNTLRHWLQDKITKIAGESEKNELASKMNFPTTDQIFAEIDVIFMSKEEQIKKELEETFETLQIKPAIRDAMKQYVKIMIETSKTNWKQDIAMKLQQKLVESIMNNGVVRIQLRIKEMSKDKLPNDEAEAQKEFDAVYKMELDSIKGNMKTVEIEKANLKFVVSTYIVFQPMLEADQKFMSDIPKNYSNSNTICQNLLKKKGGYFYLQKIDLEESSVISGDYFEKYDWLMLKQNYVVFIYRKMKQVIKEALKEISWDDFTYRDIKDLAHHRDSKLGKKLQSYGLWLDVAKFSSYDYHKKVSQPPIHALEITSHMLKHEKKDPSFTEFLPINFLINAWKIITSPKQVAPSSNTNEDKQFAIVFIKFVREELMTKKGIEELTNFSLPFGLIDLKVKEELNLSSSGREITHELIQNFANKVQETLNSLKRELSVFGVAFDQNTISSVHYFMINCLFTAHNLHSLTTNEITLRKFTSQRDHLYNMFIQQVLKGTDRDKKTASFMSEEIRNLLAENAKLEISSQFNPKIKKFAQEQTRLSIQKICDQKAYSADPTWLLAYIDDPLSKIKEHFESAFDALQKELIYEISKSTTSIKTNIISIMTAVRELAELTSNQQITLVSDLFKVTKSKDSAQAFEWKSKLGFKYVMEFLLGKNQQEKSYAVENDEFILEKLIIIGSNRLTTLSNSILVILSAIEGMDLAIHDVQFFLKQLLEELGKLNKDPENLTIKLEDVDQEKILNSIRDRAIGCDQKCPCCGRACDEEHFRFTEAIGSSPNQHKCSLGHQYRAFRGFKYQLKNFAALRFCEHLKGAEPISHQGKLISWNEFKKEYPTWSFDIAVNADLDEMKILQGKFAFIWKEIGKELCQKHDMVYTERDEAQLDSNQQNSGSIEAGHYIFVLDDSGSMSGNPWNTLVEAVRKFFWIKINDGLSHHVSIVIFGSSSRIVVENKPMEEKLIKNVNFTGGGTDYCLALEDTIRLINNYHNNGKKITVVFMSDGSPNQYPAAQLQSLSQIKSRIGNFWTLGFGNCDFQVLKNMAQQTGGTFKNALDLKEFSSSIVEIAKVN